MKRLLSVVAIVLVTAAFSINQNAPARADTGGGNSWAAHLCQHGGYLSLVGADGTTFSNTGACVSYAANGGTFATGMIIPAGHTATLSGAQLLQWNYATYGYQLNFGTNVPVGYQGWVNGWGGGTSTPDVTIGPFKTAMLLRVYLSDYMWAYYPDFVAGGTYYSDGTPVNHALVVGSNPYTVYVLDSGTNGWASQIDRVPTASSWNLQVTVTIS